MASIKEEKGSEFFSRFEKESPFHLEGDILPPLSSGDIVQISGGPGTGKTELLYHFILRCILPNSTWNGRSLRGLDTKVILIDNDGRFNLFRLIQIFEKLLEHSNQDSNATPASKEDIFRLIDSQLEQLEIVKCFGFDEFVCTLRYLEFLRPQKNVLMIDGVTSFHWSNKMRNVYSQAKVMAQHSSLVTMVRTLSQNGLPVIVTKRNLAPSYDCSKMDALWRRAATCSLELSCTCPADDSTRVTVHNVTANRRIHSTITNSGFRLN